MIPSLDCPKSVSSTRYLAALKWWLEPASPPTTDARIVVLCRSAAAPSHTPNHHTSMTLHATSQSDSELRLSQERAKYAMFGGSDVVVGTSIASCAISDARIMVL